MAQGSPCVRRGSHNVTLIPDFPTGQWLADPLSVAAARGAARSSFFGRHPTGLREVNEAAGFRFRIGPAEVNQRVAGHVGPEKLFAPLPPPPLPLCGRQASAAFRPRSAL